MHSMIWVVGIILLIVVLVVLVRSRQQKNVRNHSSRKHGARFKRTNLSSSDDFSVATSTYTSKLTKNGGFAYIVPKEVEQRKYHKKTISTNVEQTSIFHKTGFEQDLRGANSKGERLFYSLSEVGVGGADPNPVVVLVSASTLVTKPSKLSNFQATFHIKDLTSPTSSSTEPMNANLRVELFVQKAGSPDYEMTAVQWSKPINQTTETDKSMASESVVVQEGDHFVFLMYLDNTKAHASVLQLSLSYDYTTTKYGSE